MINIKTEYGAKGDGITDDTSAIQRAISDLVRFGRGGNIASRIIYFPDGVYLVSDTLTTKDHSGVWQSGLTFQGQSQDKTILKLSDHNPAYQNMSALKDFVITGSLETFDAGGGGYNGFDNYFFNITLDTGIGNPAVVALNYMGNNWCGLDRVTIRSSDPNHVGAYGIAMLRYQTGPCLMKNVVVDGFTIGIAASSQDYGVTFEYLTLKNQQLVGIKNDSDVLTIKGLTSINSVPVFQHLTNLGLLTLIDANLSGGNSQTPAILNDNSGTVYARNVHVDGYSALIRDSQAYLAGGTYVDEYNSGQTYRQFTSSALSLNLPMQDTPDFQDADLSHWTSVVAFGADLTGQRDSATAIQAAIDSGATTVYFPSGDYVISKTIYIRGNVRMIEGFDSYVLPIGPSFQDASHMNPLFQNDSTGESVTVNHFVFGDWSQSYPGLLYFRQNALSTLILKRSAYQSLGQAAMTYQNTALGTGSLFVEDTYASAIKIDYPQKVFARQIDPENGGTKITNSGGTLWVLGLKTEKGGTTIETNHHGTTELLGGFLYPLGGVGPMMPGFIITDSKASFTYALSSYVTPSPTADDGNFKLQIQETQSGVTKNLMESSIASRGWGTMMPLYRSSP